MRSYLRPLITVGLTVGLMAYFLRNSGVESVWAAILRARVDLLVLSLLATVASYVIRVERWHRLLQVIGKASWSNAYRATMIGFAANALVPGRIGEVLRPYVLSRRERLSAASAFATIMLERLLDLLAIVMLVLGFILLVEQPSKDSPLLVTLWTGAVAAGIGGVLAIVLIILGARNPKQADKVVRLCALRVPGRAAQALTRVAERFLRGLAVARQPGQLVVAMGLSVALWVSVALSLLMTSWAFGVDVSFGGSVILMGLVAIGVSVPTPAGIGGYHAAYQLGTTTLYGASVDQAVGAALVMHLISFGPVTLLGLFFMAQEGVRLGNVADLTVGEDRVPESPQVCLEAKLPEQSSTSLNIRTNKHDRSLP